MLYRILSVLLSLFILAEVNYPHLSPQSQLAFFAMLGLTLIFLSSPLHRAVAGKLPFRLFDGLLIASIIFCFGYVIIQTEPAFQTFWTSGEALGNRAGLETDLDHLVGLIGLLVVLEGTRRTIGLTLPLLAITFLIYGAFGPALPDWLFPHRGYSWSRIVSQTFLHSQGVFGIALNVMFTYVFLFVLFGTLLEKTGATGFIINFTRNLFRKSAGAPAKVAVISSGMMGSLSGSAVANTATTGTFTIPMMRSAGFKPAIAAGVEAAASSGGALVPPIMGAGAYMMLELVDPPVTYLQIMQAAILPAVLYYIALLLIVHLQAKRSGIEAVEDEESQVDKPHKFQGIVFFSSFFALILLLMLGYTPFRAVSLSLIIILIVSSFSPHSRVTFRGVIDAFENAARSGVALVAAASCVGIIIGIVTLTGIGGKLPSTILPLAQNNLLLALFLLMISTIILGMGLPSAVCYLLIATLIGPILGDLGLVPLAAHLFIFYFGMMSMVTPPVALAAYTAAAIAGAGIMRSGFAAFRFSLVGFVLPYVFVTRPELLLLAADGSTAPLLSIIGALALVLLAIIPLAAGVTGFLFTRIAAWQRIVLVISGLALVLSQPGPAQIWVQAVAFGLIIVLGFLSWEARLRPANVQTGLG